MLSRTDIAEIATDLLGDCVGVGYAPGRELENLIRQLLNADKPRLKADREFSARYTAAQIDAQASPSVRQLARAVGVNPSSVTRWRRDPAYQADVEEKRRYFADLTARGGKTRLEELTEEYAKSRSKPDNE